MRPELEELMKSYAAGKTSWAMMKARGFDNYLLVLARLHELGLRPPIAPAEAQTRGCDALREALQAAGHESVRNAAR